MQIATLFPNLTFLSNEMRRFGSLHTSLLCLALSGFKPRPAYMCIMIGRHIVSSQPQLKPCFNECFFLQILPKKTKFIPFSKMRLPWSSSLRVKGSVLPLGQGCKLHRNENLFRMDASDHLLLGHLASCLNFTGIRNHIIRTVWLFPLSLFSITNSPFSSSTH